MKKIKKFLNEHIDDIFLFALFLIVIYLCICVSKVIINKDSNDCTCSTLEVEQKPKYQRTDDEFIINSGIVCIGTIHSLTSTTLVSIDYSISCETDLNNLVNASEIYFNYQLFLSNSVSNAVTSSAPSNFVNTTTPIGSQMFYDISAYDLDLSDLENLSDLHIFFEGFQQDSNFLFAFNFGYSDSYDNLVVSSQISTTYSNLFSNITGKFSRNHWVEIVQDLTIYNDFNDEFINYYDMGYDEGFEVGYFDGLNDRNQTEQGTTNVFNKIWNLIENSINSVFNIFEYNVIPGIPIYAIIALPIIITILIFILKALIK